MRVPSVGGVKVTLEAGHVHLPLRAFKERSATEGKLLRLPRFGAPKVADELELKPIRDIAVRELLAHAVAGIARVHLPLVATKLRKGPFTIEIPANAEAVIDLEVEDGRILRERERTRGDIVPDISLPLGLKFRGIFLDDDGSIIADIARIPNLNLSWLNVARLRVPATLDAMLHLLFPEDGELAPARDDEPPPAKEGSVPVDLEGLRVEARDVTPRREPLSLGQAGELELGHATQLDVDYTSDALEIGGHFDIARADFQGEGFSLTGLRAGGSGSAVVMRTEATRRVAVELRCDEIALDAASLQLVDGSRFQLVDAVAADADVIFTRTGGEAHFHFASPRFRGRFTGGVVMMGIGRKIHPVRLADMDVEGSVVIGDRGFEVDLEVKGARIEAEQFTLPFGLAYLDVATLVASCTGRLRAGSSSGYSFNGSLAVNVDVGGGKIVAGPVSMRLLRGTQIQMSISRLIGGEQLEELETTGTAEVQLASGSIPLGERGRVHFSRGAVATLALHSLKIEPGEAWPALEAGAELTAASDAFDLEQLMHFPPGVVNVRIPHIGLEQAGELVLRDIELVLNSEDDPPQP